MKKTTVPLTDDDRRILDENHERARQKFFAVSFDDKELRMIEAYGMDPEVVKHFRFERISCEWFSDRLR